MVIIIFALSRNDGGFWGAAPPSDVIGSPPKKLSAIWEPKRMSMPKISAIDTVVLSQSNYSKLLEKSNEKTKKTLSLPLRDVCWNLRFLDPLGAGSPSRGVVNSRASTRALRVKTFAERIFA